MNTISIDQSLATFASVSDMDKTVRRFLYTHGHELTHSAIQLLKRLARYSCKVVGVSWAEAETMAPKLGISVRTFWRAVKQLESFGIISRIARRKKHGERSSNIYQIQPVEDLRELPSSSSDTLDGTLPMSHCEEAKIPYAPSVEQMQSAAETESFKTGLSSEENLKTVKREKRIPNSRVWKKVPKNVPTDFASPVMRDTADGQVAFRLWGKVLLVDKLCGFENPTTLADIASETWKRTRSLYKERDFNKFCGLFYGALKRVTAERFPLLDPFLCKR
ncbi:helix-turn-helix domain-containing protein [Brevibacillus centrosporus]|uniref:helix-turn-helix domain-containing protein n=1 Tax=Brevibacillus centrosporus TaxID=54910 RepID=UPI002E1B944C|nr:helix-turn-helix domain-containing protein [Brevibacillus centrosporus]